MLSYPIIRIQDIVNVLNSGFEGFPKIVEADIKQPTPAKVREVYETFLCLAGVRWDAAEPSFEAVQAVEHMEMYDDFQRQMAFVHALERFFKAVAYPEFSVSRDLLRPEQKRFVMALSGIINYFKFREERIQSYSEAQEQHEAVEIEKQQATEELQRLQHEAAQLRVARANEEPQIKELETEAVALSTQIDELNKTQLNLTNSSHELKQQALQFSEMLSQVKFELLSLRQEIQRLKSQIIPDPEKAKRQLKDMTATWEQERAHVEDIERKTNDARSRVEGLAKLQKELIRTQKLLEESDAERARLKELTHSIKDTKGKIALSDQKAHEVDLHQQQLLQQITSMQEKMHRLQKRHQAKREQAQQALEEARQERQRIDAEKDENRIKLEQNDQQIRLLQAKAMELQREQEQEMSLLKAGFDGLETQVRDYHQQLETAVQQQQRM